METISDTIQISKPKHRFYAFGTDRVFIALVLGFSVLIVLDPSHVYQSLRFSLQSMLEIAQFFVLAIGFAGFAKATGIDAHITRVFSGKSWATIPAAIAVYALVRKPIFILYIFLELFGYQCVSI